MKVLFIGPYQQRDGWGVAAQSFIKALENKCDLSVKNIFLSANKNNHIKEKLFKNLNKKENSYDAIIQKVIPSMITYNYNCGINCAFSCLETIGMQFDWNYAFGLVDKIFTFTESEKNNNSWLNDNINYVGQPIDVEACLKEYPILKNLGTGYKFYFIGENIERKRLVTLIRCYLTEFSASDNVNLVIKSDNKHNITDMIKKIQSSIRKYHIPSMYPMISHVDGYISEEQMYSLHQSCDCFVMPSCGEAFCRPLAEALCFNNQLILTKNTFMSELVNDDNAWIVNSRKNNVTCLNPPLLDIYTSNEYWFEIDELELMRAMREAYDGQVKINEREKLINKLSYDTVGNNIIKCLES